MRYRWTCPSCGHSNVNRVNMPNYYTDAFETVVVAFVRCHPDEGCGQRVTVDLLIQPRVVAVRPIGE